MFKVKNYLSFKGEAILDMRATSYKQHMSHLLETSDGTKLVKTAAIYGANASGKSNFISAMFFFEKYIFEQFITKSTAEEYDFSSRNLETKLEAFELSNNYNDASEFDIIFTSNESKIQYGFECTSNEVLNEWYFINDKKVFERVNDVVTFGNLYSKYIKSFTKVPKERLYLSVLEYFLEKEDKKIVLDDFVEFFQKEYDVFLEIFFESTIKSIAGLVRLNNRIVEDISFRKNVEKYLSQIDVGIKGLDVEVQTIIDPKTGKEKRKKIVKTIHDVYDENGDVACQKLFELQKESTGTLRFLTYIQEVIGMTERGGVFVVDEISARLHPLLTKLIVDIFQDSKNSKAQLIFTTHDISLLNKEQFRRDEVNFVDKNNRGESSIYALSDLKVRDDATFNKDYLQGKYGAIPIFNYDEIVGGDIIGQNHSVACQAKEF
jgi:AAA15 family ATPase/GTPase